MEVKINGESSIGACKGGLLIGWPLQTGFTAHLYSLHTGKLPSFQTESDHMSEVLQAHRVNLAAAQNLR